MIQIINSTNNLAKLHQNQYDRKLDYDTNNNLRLKSAYTLVDHEDFRCQFHQHFTYKFFVRTLFRQLFLHTHN
jgi:hypothetical protein